MSSKSRLPRRPIRERLRENALYTAAVGDCVIKALAHADEARQISLWVRGQSDQIAAYIVHDDFVNRGVDPVVPDDSWLLYLGLAFGDGNELSARFSLAPDSHLASQIEAKGLSALWLKVQP